MVLGHMRRNRSRALPAPGEPAPAEAMLRLFAVVWAFGSLAHTWANPRSGLVAFRWMFPQPRAVADYFATEVGFAHLAMTLAAVAVLLRPDRTGRLVLLAALQVLVAWLEMSYLGNHWLLVALVALGLLLAAARVYGAVRALDAAGIAARFLPVARTTLLVAYGFAAFSKLNEGFLTPSRSCATFFTNQLLAAYGLPALAGEGAVGWANMVGTVAVECSIPILLLLRRTRHAGVAVGLVFHSVIALDVAHLFIDFSAVLVALFVLFLPPAFAVSCVRAWTARRREVALFTGAALLVSVILWVWPAVPPPRWFDVAAFALWLVLDVAVLVAVGRYLWRERPAAERGALRIGSPRWLAVVPLLALLNGLTPYFEVKTGFGWNMYSNLVTVAGRSNHLLIPATVPLSDTQRHLVTVLDSGDRNLRQYAQRRYRLTVPQVRAYAERNPGAWLRYELDGTVRLAPRIGADPLLGRPVPLWQEKLLLFRAVDMEDPPRCQDTWGPAR